jgi:hypothetical protein
MGKQSIKFHPQISLVSPLSRCAQSFLHKKNSLHNIMAEQGPKVGDARSLWNFTPSPGILLHACSFFLSLCLLRAFVLRWWWWCLGFGDVRLSRLNFWNDDVKTIRFLVLLLARRLSLSKTRLLSRLFRFCASLVLSLKTCTNVFFFIFNNAHQNASFHRTPKQDGRNRRLKI